MERLLARNAVVKLGSKLGNRTVIGQPFLAKVQEGARVRNRPHCVLRCECGRVSVHRLYGRLQTDCQCVAREAARLATTKHGMTGTRLHNIWKGMKERCGNPSFAQFHDYGGRGIAVCDEWVSDFCAFHAWAMVNGYDDSLEIDRKDNDLGYSPANCRWVPNLVNQRNKRNIPKREAFGERKPLWQWAEDPRCRVSIRTVKSRLQNGWSLEDAMTEPAKFTPRWHGVAP